MLETLNGKDKGYTVTHLKEMNHKIDKLKMRGLDLKMLTRSALKKTKSVKDTSEKHDERQ